MTQKEHGPCLVNFRDRFDRCRQSTELAGFMGDQQVGSRPEWQHVADQVMLTYIELAGVIVDICEEDWSPGVTDAAVSITPHESIALTHSPIEDSIRVFLDGVLNGAWSYSATDNTIYFSTIPGPGVLVEVGYRYLEETDTGGDSGA